jgi:O6-methylguanine-DNA--protein-cysteine methyltransferase
LVARSADGVCAILIGYEAAELESDLATRFTDSKLVRNDRKLSDDLRKILRFIEAPSEGLNLPLDIRGTPFQQRVWEALLRIPLGSIVTYRALANRIGAPGAQRIYYSAQDCWCRGRGKLGIFDAHPKRALEALSRIGNGLGNLAPDRTTRLF